MVEGRRGKGERLRKGGKGKKEEKKGRMGCGWGWGENPIRRRSREGGGGLRIGTPRFAIIGGGKVDGKWGVVHIRTLIWDGEGLGTDFQSLWDPGSEIVHSHNSYFWWSQFGSPFCLIFPPCVPILTALLQADQVEARSLKHVSLKV